ncbi:MAG TPA: AraC family transcriptional regulator [Bradyrhizobium sp.]|nr:AraC family transcriptional regulator [Bradyrhizobium sp.]
MNELVPPDRVIDWIPGNRTLDSTSKGWKGLQFIGYHYNSMAVSIPQMRDYMIVVYRGAATRMGRYDGGKWQHEVVERGTISLLTRAEASHWAWGAPIDVQHIYLSHESICDVAGEIFDRPLCDIEIRDRVRSEDAVFPRIADALAHELSSDSMGAGLFAESLRVQSCIQLLRHYADIDFREPSSSGVFSNAERRILCEYLRMNLNRNLSLDDMATQLHLSSFHFLRKFKASFGLTPHQFLVAERIRRAKSLLCGSNMSIALIAAETGFSDQSHFTRLFRRVVGVTPAKFRQG